MIFDRNAEGVVNRQVQFLDLVGLLSRRPDSDVSQTGQAAAASAGQADDRHLPEVSDLHGQSDITGVSRGRQGDQHIARAPQAIELLSRGESVAEVIADCCSDAYLAHEGKRTQAALQPVSQ